MYMAAEMDSGNNWHFDNYAYTRATSAEHKKNSLNLYCLSDFPYGIGLYSPQIYTGMSGQSLRWRSMVSPGSNSCYCGFAG